MADVDTHALSQAAFLVILLVTVLLGYIIRLTGFKYATEGSAALLVGVATGGVMAAYYWLLDPEHHLPGRLVEFDEAIFFQTLLPPIIFSAGFSVKKKLFFRNFITLMLFGVGGTLFMAAVLAAGSQRIMAWGAEQAGNLPYSSDDAQELRLRDVGVLALQFLRLFALSTALGLAVGVASAAVIRWLFRRPSPDREVLVVALMGLAAYFLAEGAGLSAILSVFFCGIAMSHYTWHNLSPAAKVITRHGFHVISTACEVVLFVYAGLDVWVTAAW
ncbi:Sodium/hydrogen exchanger 3, partial [Tetrabaena socialis]